MYFCLIHVYTFNKRIRGSIRAGITVATLRILPRPLTLMMPLAVCTVTKADPEFLPAATRFGTLTPITPVTPAVYRKQRVRKMSAKTSNLVPRTFPFAIGKALRSSLRAQELVSSLHESIRNKSSNMRI